MRLKLVPRNTSWNFFLRSKLWIGISIILVVLSLISFFVQSLNFAAGHLVQCSVRVDQILGDCNLNREILSFRVVRACVRLVCVVRLE